MAEQWAFLEDYPFLIPDFPDEPLTDTAELLPRSGRKELFGPSGLLERPTTNDEIKKLHVKERKGFGKWVGKMKDVAGEFKVASKGVLGDLIDKGGRFPGEVTRELDGQRASQDYAPRDVTNGSNASPNFAVGLTGRMVGFPTGPSTLSSLNFASLAKPQPSISLSPTIQARLFGELELLVARNLNEYLIRELKSGHLSANSVERICKKWTDGNRPLPTQFYFDFGTQLEFIHANFKQLQFSGGPQTSIAVIQSMLKSWSALAKRLTRKTLCTPDSDIRIHLTDIGNMFRLLSIEETEWNIYNYWCNVALDGIEAAKQNTTQ